MGDRRRPVGALVALGLLLAGCASIPEDGPVSPIDSSPSAEGESRVRVFGVSPQRGDGPQEIVRGFLEATTSDEPEFQTAQRYLTGPATRWDPFDGTTVLADAPRTQAPQRDAGEDGGYTVQVSGARTAHVDRGHAYSPDPGAYSRNFHVVKTREGWRIDRLPAGLVIGESDFQRVYRSVNTYYYAKLGPEAASLNRAREVLVADPLYLRRRIDLVTQTVRSLLGGPTDWLRPVVSTSFPAGSRLAPGQYLSLDDSGVLSLRLNDAAAGASRTQCGRMAAQVLHTVQAQASAKVSQVELSDEDGEALCDLSRDEGVRYEPGRSATGGGQQYLIDSEHQVATLTAPTGEPQAVTGPLGSGQVPMSSVAVSHQEEEGAGVSLNRRELYVASLSHDEPLGDPVLTSRAVREKDRLTAPSWDGLGDLWTADRDPRGPRLWRLRGGTGEPEEIAVPGLGEGERIEALRISSDGVRIAMRVRNRSDDHSALLLGRVERTGTREDPVVSVAALRDVAPQLENAGAVSWAGHARLVVVGREAGSVQQLQYIGTDGSTAVRPGLPSINNVLEVAASENEQRPLVARSDYGVVWLQPGADWKTVTEEGTEPVYPG